MWRCSKCNASLDDSFGTCWNCGTNQDGTVDPDFHRKPNDPGVSDSGIDDELDGEHSDSKNNCETDDSRTCHLKMVELCSAANGIEAYTIKGALEAADIKAEVTGDMLQSAAGGLPLGETIAPRIWVASEDEQRAREVLDDYQNDADAETQALSAAKCEEDYDAWTKDEEPVDAPLADEQPRHDVSLLSVLLAIAGMSCIGVGTYYFYANQSLLNRYSCSVPADQISSEPEYSYSGSGWESHYVYRVDGDSHEVHIGFTQGRPPQCILVYYDPNHPGDYRLQSVPAPAWCLAYGIGLGAFLFFLAYQFR